ncbi:MAG: extensin family protein [Alphaproteobacteria bacterium]|nr:MAG: extensin family protein [Alphaproteobacteria bacterium]
MCDDPRLAGQTITRIASATPGCGIERPVRLSAVAGVRLDRPAIGDCRLASRLADWIERVARPAARGLGSELVSIEVAASYACRPRNNRPGARLSEHARGRAIDIAAFGLADGRRITVLDGWRGEARAFLARLHRRACGIFGTVLGPDSDRWHRNHFHFDVARYRMGSYCR